MFIVLFLGAPGSGKGSLSQLLVQNYGFTHFSTGKIFRALRDKNSEQGTLVSDDQVNDLVIKELKNLYSINPDIKIVLDGYPRTIVQAKFIKKHFPIDMVVHLTNITDEYIIERLSNRLLCEQEDHSYNLIYCPPKVKGICDHDGSRLYRRSDDSEEIIQKRLNVYRESTQPLIDYYRSMENFVEIDATKKIDVLCEELKDCISKFN